MPILPKGKPEHARALSLLKVLHFITDLGSGGAERALSRVVLADVQEPQVQHFVVSLMGEGVYGKAISGAGVDLRCLGVRRSMVPFGALVRSVRTIRRVRPDIVMTWLYHADLLGTAAAILAGFPLRRVVWNLRTASMDFSHFGRSTRYVTAVLARLSPFPGAVVTNASCAQEDHARIGYRPRQWLHVPNGFETDVWRPDPTDRATVRAEFGLQQNQTAVVLVARAAPQKDHGTFLHSAKQVLDARPNTLFFLIGRETEMLPIPSELDGHMVVLGERRDVHWLLRGFDIAVLSSSSGEAFPNAIGEAMATGLPAVVTDVGDAPIIVGETGIVVPSRNPDRLAEAILTLMGEDEGARTTRSQAARDRITSNYALKRLVTSYQELWLDLANQ